MQIENFLSHLNVEFYTGVPDSQLKPLCDYLIEEFGISNKHIVAANEGNAVALAAGYYLSTGKIPVVYMQNSGIGNIINPATSLLHKKVYGIPCIYIVGWRGEPLIHDEPQHVFQGEVTIKLLEDVDIHPFIVSKETTDSDFNHDIKSARKILDKGGSIAFVIKKNALVYDEKIIYRNEYTIIRENAIEKIIENSKNDIIVSTTGKCSRELFEIRENKNQGHCNDFLTVGSMGHCSSIALGIALQKPNKKVWCLDGDGAAIMHMGAMSVIGSCKPINLIHVLLDNGSHETVGGMPTVSKNIDWEQIAYACGYQNVVLISSSDELDTRLAKIRLENVLTFVVIKCSIHSRSNLGRPTVSTEQNKKDFMEYLLNNDLDI